MGMAVFILPTGAGADSNKLALAKQADAFVHEVYKRSNNPSEKPSRKMLECTRDIFSKFPQSVKSVIYKKG